MVNQGNGNGEDHEERLERERLRVEREQERQRSAKRLRSLKAGGVLIFVLCIGALVAVAVTDLSKGGEQTTDTKPVITGSEKAPATLTVYEDFRCPACGQFEDRFRGTIDKLRDEGKLTVQYHLVTIIDDNRGGNGSMAAANAALCAEDQKQFAAYHDVLYKHQPPEDDDAFADKHRLLQLAAKVDGLGSSTEFEDCVLHDKESGRVKRSTSAFDDSPYHSTPTVLLNGKSIYGTGGKPLTPQRLEKMVEAKQ